MKHPVRVFKGFTKDPGLQQNPQTPDFLDDTSPCLRHSSARSLIQAPPPSRLTFYCAKSACSDFYLSHFLPLTGFTPHILPPPAPPFDRTGPIDEKNDGHDHTRPA